MFSQELMDKAKSGDGEAMKELVNAYLNKHSKDIRN